MKTKNYLLITYNFDWADEFSVQGFGVYSVEQWEKVKNHIKGLIKTHYEFGFGTNEYLTFENFAEWKRGIIEKEISDQEAQMLIKLFNLNNPDCADFMGPVFGVATGVIDFDCEYYEKLEDKTD